MSLVQLDQAVLMQLRHKSLRRFSPVLRLMGGLLAREDREEFVRRCDPEGAGFRPTGAARVRPPVIGDELPERFDGVALVAGQVCFRVLRFDGFDYAGRDRIAILVRAKLDLPVHSDQGSRFTSREWQAFLRQHGLEPSMSPRGNCHDNAVAESFFQLPKRARIRRRTCPARDAARQIAAAEKALRLADACPRELIAERGRDADDRRSGRLIHGVRPIIPWKTNRREPGTRDRARHRLRNRIARMIGVLGHSRRLDTRCDRTAASVLGLDRPAAIRRWTRRDHTARAPPTRPSRPI